MLIFHKQIQYIHTVLFLGPVVTLLSTAMESTEPGHGSLDAGGFPIKVPLGDIYVQIHTYIHTYIHEKNGQTENCFFGEFSKENQS